MCVKLARDGGGGFFSYRVGQHKGCPTKRAVDGGDSASSRNSFLASGFSYSQVLSQPAHTQVTQTVGRLVSDHGNVIIKKKAIMNVCAKCGFENDDNVKNCINCLTDLHWAKVNLGKFQGNKDDTRKIGIESRKERGYSVPEDEFTPLEPIQIVKSDFADMNKSLYAFTVGGIAGFIGGFLRFTMAAASFDFGIPMLCLAMPIFSPLAGVLSVFLLSYFIEKSKPNYLLFCALIGFLAGFLPFDYWFNY